jgi:hypothetical protein
VLINSEFRPLVDDTRRELPTLRAVIEFDNIANATKDFLETPETLCACGRSRSVWFVVRQCS